MCHEVDTTGAVASAGGASGVASTTAIASPETTTV
jgi:hypothetical protein